MADLNSPNVARAVASPVAMTDVSLHGARDRHAQGQFEVPVTSQLLADIITLELLPSNSVINTLILRNDDLDTVADFDIDVGVRNEDGSAISAAASIAFAEDSIIFQAAQDGADLRFDNADINTQGQRLFELAGLAEDPGGRLAIAVEVATVPAGVQAGTVAYDIGYGVD